MLSIATNLNSQVWRENKDIGQGQILIMKHEHLLSVTLYICRLTFVTLRPCDATGTVTEGTEYPVDTLPLVT